MRRRGNDDVIELADFELTRGGDQAVVGETAAGAETSGSARTWWVRYSDEVLLLIGDIEWSTGERDLRVLDRGHSPPEYDRLTHGLRLGVHEHGDERFVELRQNRLKPNGWSGLHRADVATLSAGANVDVEEALLEAGATAVGTRQVVLEDGGRRRAETCVVFPAGELRAPAVAYVVTRVLPVHHGVTDD